MCHESGAVNQSAFNAVKSGMPEEGEAMAKQLFANGERFRSNARSSENIGPVSLVGALSATLSGSPLSIIGDRYLSALGIKAWVEVSLLVPRGYMHVQPRSAHRAHDGICRPHLRFDLAHAPQAFDSVCFGITLR